MICSKWTLSLETWYNGGNAGLWKIVSSHAKEKWLESSKALMCWGRAQREGAAGLIFSTSLLNHSGTAHIFQGSSILCYGFRGAGDRSNYIKRTQNCEEQNMIWYLDRLLSLGCRAGVQQRASRLSGSYFMPAPNMNHLLFGIFPLLWSVLVWMVCKG